MIKLAEVMEKDQTYQVVPMWSHKESYYVKVSAGGTPKLEANQYTCVVHDDKQLLELRKRKSRTIYLPYHAIRFVEVSPASDVAKQLFG